ncbi:MAG: response regulator [Verrucomicrobiales bacterium]|nr:response regulator [Verrucomicrobiales bacterium]
MRPPVVNQSVSVAVVDDDESIGRAFSRLLRYSGFQPVTYTSAEALLQDTRRPRFDCLILDIQLPGMSGLELAEHLRSIRDLTPVIFVTAHDEPEVRAQATALPCAEYFRKTDAANLVLDALRRAVGLPAAPSQNRIE